MARTWKHLFEQVVSIENLWCAYTNARRGKRYKEPAAAFDMHIEDNLVRLRRELMQGTYRPGGYAHFYIYEPKKRLISAAPFRDRVVHHAIVNVLEPLYEARFSGSSYACRKGKGTHKAIEAAHWGIRNCRWFLKGDIVKFFPSVDHGVLMRLVSEKIADPALIELIQLIVDSGRGVLDAEWSPAWFPGDSLLGPLERHRGLPIGNLTSQFFANVLLNELDMAVHHDIGPRRYVRYSDDFLLFDNDRGRLDAGLAHVRETLAGLRLKCHPRKTCIRPAGQGVKFLGFRLLPATRRVDRQAINRFRNRMRRYAALWEQRQVGLNTIGASVRGWLAHVAHANSQAMTRQVLRDVRLGAK